MADAVCDQNESTVIARAAMSGLNLRMNCIVMELALVRSPFYLSNCFAYSLAL